MSAKKTEHTDTNNDIPLKHRIIKMYLQALQPYCLMVVVVVLSIMFKTALPAMLAGVLQGLTHWIFKR